MKLRNTLLTVLALLALAGAAAYAFRGPLSMAVARQVVAERLRADAQRDLPDGLHVGVCGAGSPFPDEHRAGPCTVVVAGSHLYVFDAGSGSPRNIGKMGFVHGRIEAIFLTHFHSDHIDGLGELLLQRWVTTGNQAPVPVYGPPGVAQVVGGLRQAYTLDQHYRVAHHGDATMPASGTGGVAQVFPPGPGEPLVVLQQDGVEISAFLVDHAPIHPAVGYRIRYKGRSVVLSGDTRKSAAVQAAARGADVLVHEALSEPLMAVLEGGAAAAGRPKLGKVFHDVLNYHTTPEQAAEVARDAGVRYLLLNHIVPALPFPGMEQAFLGGAGSIFGGPVRVAADGDFLSLPAGSEAINVSKRF